MRTYSFSQITTYETCPMKYKFEKIDLIKPKFEQNLNLILGTTVHDTLEELYKKVGDFRIMSLDEVLSFFRNERDENIKHIDNSAQRYTESEIQSFCERGKIYLEQYYEKKSPFNEDKLFGTEENINFDLSESISFKGKIDRIDMNDDQIIINDYKTNKKIMQDNKDKIQEQINLYGLGIKQLYASKMQSKKIFGRVYYLHFDTEYKREITQQKLDDVKQKYLLLTQEIEAKRKLFDKGNQNAFEVKVGTHCDYCPFKVICPARKNESMADEKLQNPIGDIDTIRQLVDKTKKLADEIKTLEAKEAFYKEIIINYAKENGLKKLFGDLYKVSFSTRDSYSIDEESEDKIIEILKSHGIYDQLLKLDSTKFTKFIKEGKINFDEIEDSVNHKESFYISRISAKKDGEEE